MKINFKDKNTRIITIVLAVVILPILYHQISGFIIGQISAYRQSLPKEVQVMNPKEIEINPEFETTGRVEARDSINVIARVSGWLKQVYFTEGEIVKKGQKLYEIEPDEYVYAVKNAQATVNENRAVFQNSEVELKRAKTLLKQDFVSQEYYDDAITERNKHRAALDGSIEQLNKAKLDLSYTTVLAPMNGRIGKNMVSKGNYVNASAGTLTSIYLINPIRVVFSLKSSMFVQMKKYIAQNEQAFVDKELPVDVYLKLSDGTIYEKTGTIEYFDNKIDETTGTITLRAIFDNAKEILVPGDYVGVVLKMRSKEKVMTVPQSATKTDVGTGYYVWSVQDGKTVKKDIVVKNNIDNNWVVQSGLTYDDVVIVKGIQDIYQSGQAVKPEPFVEENEQKKEAE